jgi:hypothetical protein
MSTPPDVRVRMLHTETVVAGNTPSKDLSRGIPFEVMAPEASDGGGLSPENRFVPVCLLDDETSVSSLEMSSYGEVVEIKCHDGVRRLRKRVAD